MKNMMKSIKVIKLLKLNYNYLDFKFLEEDDYYIGVSMAYKVNSEVVAHDENTYSAVINFTLYFTEQQYESEIINEDYRDINELNGIDLDYQIFFDGDFDVTDEDQRELLINELIKAVEPFCRNKVEMLLSESKRKVPDMPYFSYDD